MTRDTGPQMPKVSAATLAKEGTPVAGTAIDAEYGNTVYEYQGNIFIVGRNGKVLGWEPRAVTSNVLAGGLLGGMPAVKSAARGLLDY